MRTWEKWHKSLAKSIKLFDKQLNVQKESLSRVHENSQKVSNENEKQEKATQA